MQKIRSTTELTEAEVRMLLQEKLRKNRQKRLQSYRRTGRAITLVPDYDPGLNLSLFLEIDNDLLAEKSPTKHRIGTRIAHHVLGWVEMGAVLSVVALFWFGWQGLGDINRLAAAAWVFPTPTPTPLIQAIVLPDGHTPPNRPGGSQPNIEEVPEHLRALVKVYASIPTPTPAPKQGVRIQIPTLKIDSPIVQGDGWEQLMKGVAQHIGTADPGEKGNMVLSGHNDTYGEVFRYLDRLKPGDEIYVFTFTQKFTYIVEGWTLVNPDQVEVMDPTPDETLTLISCYPYLVDNQRIIVKARLVKG